jgi:hypothetical protein
MLYSFRAASLGDTAASLLSAINKLNPQVSGDYKNLVKEVSSADAQTKSVTNLKKVMNGALQKYPAFERACKYVMLMRVESETTDYSVDSWTKALSEYGFAFSGVLIPGTSDSTIAGYFDAAASILPSNQLKVDDLGRAWSVLAAATVIFATSGRGTEKVLNDVMMMGTLVRESGYPVTEKGGEFQGPIFRLPPIIADLDRTIQSNVFKDKNRNVNEDDDMTELTIKTFGSRDPLLSLAVGYFQLHQGAFESAISALTDDIKPGKLKKSDWVLSATWPWWGQYWLKQGHLRASVRIFGLEGADPISSLADKDTVPQLGILRFNWWWCLTGQPAIYIRTKSKYGRSLSELRSGAAKKSVYLSIFDAPSETIASTYNISPLNTFSEVCAYGVSPAVRDASKNYLGPASASQVSFEVLSSLSGHLVDESVIGTLFSSIVRKAEQEVDTISALTTFLNSFYSNYLSEVANDVTSVQTPVAISVASDAGVVNFIEIDEHENNQAKVRSVAEIRKSTERDSPYITISFF